MKIDKLIPPPPPNRKWVELLKKMGQGDSVLLSEKEEHCFRVVAYSKGHKISRRRDKKGGYRVWLID